MMIHINGPERKDISLRCCVTETGEMFDSAKRNKEVDGGEKQEGARGRGEGGGEEGRTLNVILSAVQNANDCRWRDA